MTEQLIHFDVAAFVVLGITLISQLTRNMKKGSTNRFFLSLVVLTMLFKAFLLTISYIFSHHNLKLLQK